MNNFRDGSGDKKPLVSFCLMSCRQPKYIGEAMRSALAQDYENLEVVVSDDGSQDGTWEIVQEIAAEYNGPHKLILNRNEHGLGTIGNWQKLCELSHGELLIKADGDDIAYSYRASAIVEDWEKSGRKAVVFASSYDIITKDGAPAGENVLPGGWDERTAAGISDGLGFFYLGAVFACHRSLYDEFPPVTHMKSSDCSVFEARGLICRGTFREDGIHHAFRTISRPLIKYRLGSGDTTGGAYRKFMARGAERVLEARRQSLLDLESNGAHLPKEYVEKLRATYEAAVRHQHLVLKMYTGKTLAERYAGFHEATHWMKPFSKGKIIGLAFLLPPRVGDLVISLMRRIAGK